MFESKNRENDEHIYHFRLTRGLPVTLFFSEILKKVSYEIGFIMSVDVWAFFLTPDLRSR